MVNSLTELAAAGGISSTIGNQTSRLSSLLTAAASGNRITRALDDIASLSVATALSTETSSLRIAVLNVNQASSFLGVADGGISQIGGILDRLTQLATQANSGALSDSAREGIDAEFQQLVDEIDRLAGNTNFNGVNLLDGSLSDNKYLETSKESLTFGDVRLSGVIGDDVITNDQGAEAISTITFVDSGAITAGNSISIDDGAGGTVDFTFVNGTPANANEIEIGATLEQTLENAANTLNNYSGADDFGISQLNFSVDGNQLVIENKLTGNALAQDGTTPIGVSETTGGTLSNASLSNGTKGGIDTTNVTSGDFLGKVSGFDATFVGNDRVNLSVTVGGETYRASAVDTNSATDQTVTFVSENGGSFDVTFAGGNGQSVSNGDEADNFAARVDAAFSGVEFSQTREITNFTAAGDLAGASLSLTSANFDNLAFDGANVSNGRLEIEIGGNTFRSADLGDSIGVGERVTLTADNGDTLLFVNGDTRFDLASDAGSLVADVEGALTSSGGGASFQISSSADGAIQLGIGNFTAAGLGLSGLNLLSASSTATAFGAVGAAIQTLTSQRADVGAFQQALDFAAANIESALQNQEAARSTLTDTDIAANSTETSLLEAARQAAVSTLTQTNRLQSNLLKLIQ